MSTINGVSGLPSGIAPESLKGGITSAASAGPIELAHARSEAAKYISQYEGETGAAIIYTKLQENGVTVVNGYSGGAVLPLLDQFHYENPRREQDKYPKIRWITNSNESSAGHVAEGYAKSMPIGDKLPVAVAVATSGPGVTNLITPLQDAICDGVPIVVLCGQAATTAPADAFQSAPAVAMTKPCTKWSYQIKSAVELPFVMDYAFYVARNGRPGPVFIDLPKDLQVQSVTKEKIEEFVGSIHALADLPNKDIDDGDFVRFVARRRFDGTPFHALHMGTTEKGLCFEVNESKHKNDRKLDAVQNIDDLFHADHHPTNTIFRNEGLKIGGEGTSPSGMNELRAGTPILDELIDAIRLAKKPIIIAGQGCNDSADELKEFAEMMQIPVTTTLHALGSFDERHELALNMMGMHGHATPNFMVQEADLVLCIGSRFDDRITGRIGDFVPEARKAELEGRGGVIHVDVRKSENAKQVKPTFFVHSTGKNFLQVVNAALKNRGITTATITQPWIQRKKELQEEFPVGIPIYKGEEVTVNGPDGKPFQTVKTRMSAQTVISEMNKQLLEANEMDNAIFSTGVGIHQMVAAQLITWTQPRQMLSSGSLGTMGVALGYAIGAKLANGKKIVVAVDGDGSFNMTFTELKSVAEQKIPVKIMILDNEAQMMVEYWQRLFHESRYLAVRNSHNPDYSKLAESFGIKSLYCDCIEDLPDRMNEFLFSDPDEPVLFHVRIERTPCLPMVAPGQPLTNMILEDKDFEVDKTAAPS